MLQIMGGYRGTKVPLSKIETAQPITTMTDQPHDQPHDQPQSPCERCTRRCEQHPRYDELRILLGLFAISATVSIILGIVAASNYSQKHNYVSSNTHVTNHTISTANCEGEVCYVGGIITPLCQKYPIQVVRAEIRGAAVDYLDEHYPIGHELTIWVDGGSCTLDPGIYYLGVVIILIMFSCISLLIAIAAIISYYRKPL